MEKISGIYEIRNVVNGNRYIGSSSDIKHRWYVHKNKLRKGKHYNPHLQNAWNKYNEKVFIFNVLLLCDSDNLLFYEQVYLDVIKPEYNIALYADAPTRGRKMPSPSEETRRKIDAGNKGKIISEWHKQRLREANLGKKHSNKTREKCRQAAYKRRVTDETRRKLSEAMKGKKNSLGYRHSEETKRKLREANLGNKNALGYRHSEEAKQRMSDTRKEDYRKKKFGIDKE